MKEPAVSPDLTPEEGEAAVAIARAAVESDLGARAEPADEELRDPGGVFVTLKRGGELRGCMGAPLSDTALHESIPDAARKAAFRDPRFPSLREEELTKTTFEVTVLTPPREIDPGDVEVGRHGLLMEKSGRAGLLLPQVPEEQDWNREQYLEGLCRKAGLPPGTHRSATLKAFEGQVFRETEPRGPVEEID